MKMIAFFVVILAQILPMGAKTQIRTDTLKRNSLGFKRELPSYKNGKRPSYYLNKGSVEHMMGLGSLENGFDSLQLRFWYGYARTDSSQLIVFSRKDKQWSAQLFNFVYIVGEDGKRIKSIKKNEKAGLPKSGWVRFMDALSELSIASLPDENEIGNYPQYADGNSVIVEVATKNSYRIYSYKEPMKVQAEIGDAKKIEQALIFIEDQFNFKRLQEF